VFTSGGTESNNLAIFGAVGTRLPSGANAVTTAAEHPSALECFKALEKRGLAVKYIKAGAGGIDLDELRGAADAGTVLVSVSHINNETGAVRRIDEIGRIIKNISEKIIFHVDGVQSFGKYPVEIYNSKIDLFSFNSHKIHGLKGAGGLFIKKGARVQPVFYGGGQQKNLRPGTEDAAGIAAFAEAAKIAYRDMEKNLQTVKAVRDELLKIRDHAGVFINGDLENGSPYIINLSFAGHKGEVILNALSEEGICVSTGSACGGRHNKNNALIKMGLSKERAESAVRFSFSGTNTIDEAARCVEILKKILGRI